MSAQQDPPGVSREYLERLAERVDPSLRGSKKYTRRYDKFWGALDARKGQHVAEDVSSLWLKYYRADNPNRQQRIKRRIRTGDV